MTADTRAFARSLLLIAIAASLLAAALPGSALAQVSFVAREDYPAGTGPHSVAVADVNGDGRLDLAVANSGSNTVSVLLGRGDGTFSPASSYEAGSGPQSVAVADLNGDGKPDLAVANSASNNVSVSLGNGDGTFQAAQTFAADAGPQAVAVGDFNRDGRPDLAVANGGANTVLILLGNGDGTFQAGPSLGAGTGPQAVMVGDFNRDGLADLAVADSGANAVSVLLGNGDGTFRAALSFAAGNSPFSVAAGDFNRDGLPDLAVGALGANTVSVLLGNGDGTFQAARAFVADNGADAVAVGDFDRDGLLDLAVGGFYANTVSLLRGNGDGTFRAPVSFGTGSRPWSVATGDFNGDGAPDLAVANDGSGTVSVLRGSGNGTFPTAPVLQVGNQPTSAAVGDFNRDGFLDLAVSDYSTDSVSVLRGNGDGTFQPATTFGAGRGPWSVTVVDLNLDGVQDLAVADIGGNAVSVLLGHGDGTFGAALSFAADINPTCVAAGDLNRDGRADLVVANSNSNTVSILLGNGDGTFQATRNVIAGSGPSSAVIGDFNGDGLADVVVTAYYSNLISVLLGNGDGTFQPPRLYDPGGSNPWWVAVGDFNRDGTQDLAVAHYHSNSPSTASVLLGNGDGTFRPAVSFDVGAGAAYITAADVNGDGWPDLVVANYGSNFVPVLFVSVLLGNGDGTFQTARNFGAGPGPYSVAVGDFNGDGKPDLGVANFGSSTVSILANNTVSPNTLTVNKTGAGGGTVTSNPAGINCGANCSASYASGTVVTLTAAPDGGSTFTGWSGGGCSGTSTCTVTMTSSTVITATFTPVPPDTTPPTISGVTASGITSTGATIAWTTNEASDSQVEYGPTVAYGSSTTLNSSLVTSHSQTLSSLAASTLYHYRVKSKDAAGNLATSGDFTFTTAAGAALSAPLLKWSYGGCLAGPWCDTGWYASPAVADLDGDGQPDVIWGGYDAVALRGDNGSLKWRGASNNRIWPGIAIADLTGDGTLEVIVGRSSNELTVYNRSGSVVWTRNPFGTGNEVRSLAVADLDGDGQLEIIAGRAGNGATRQLSVFEPNGTVRPGWPARHDGDPGYGAGMYNENIAVADMNGDGFKEIFGPTASQYITALDRSGNQLPTSSIYNGFSPVGPKVWSQVGVNVDQAADLRGYANCGVENRPEFSYSAPVIADVNGDGVPELIVVGNVYDCNSGTDLYHIPFILKLDRTRWSGSGFDWTVIPTPSPGSAPLAEDYSVIEDVVPSPAVADLDGDGRKEIIYPSYDGRVHAFWLDKTEHGSWPYTIPTRGAPGDDFRFASEPVVADLDNDGHAEVIFTSWPKKGTGGVGQLHVLDYLGVELYRVDLPDADLNGGENGGLGAPTLANIDSDPDLEVVVGTIAGGVAAYDLPNTANARILWGTGRGSYRRTGTAAPP